MIVIDVNLQDDNTTPSTSDLLNDIVALPSIRNENEISITAISEKSKNKKKKKKKKGISGLTDLDFDIMESAKNDDDKLSLIELDEKFHDMDDEDINSSILSNQLKNYSKMKSSKKYDNQFADELAMLTTLYKETEKISKNLETEYIRLIGMSKARSGLSKSTVDLGQTVLTSKQTKLAILKEKIATKKTIADLDLKAKAQEKGKDDKDNGAEKVASEFINRLMDNRQSFIAQMTGGESIGSFLTGDRDYTSNTDPYAGLSGPYGDYDSDIDVESVIEDRLSSIDNNSARRRTSNGNKYIEYENRNVRVIVRKCLDTNDWHMIAVDSDDEVIDDYPLPQKKHMGRLKFSDDQSYCTDELGRTYEVETYYLDDEDDDE